MHRRFVQSPLCADFSGLFDKLKMKLDTKYLRYLTPEDWRVLTAVEIGSKNHEVVPTTLITQLSNLHSGSGNGRRGGGKKGNGGSSSSGSASGGAGGGGGGGVHKSISTLAKANLIARPKNAKYDGYRLTYGGLDYLAFHTHLKHNTLYSTGPCIGTGKESDIYVCAAPDGTQYVVKIHRLGRISFRSIKNNRDYLRHRSSASWMYMSRLAAQKEFLFMKALRENGFRVPRAIAQNRHTVVMELVDGVPLRSVKRVGDPAGLYADLIEIILKLAQHGLIHGDFNEFNIMVQDDVTPLDENEKEEHRRSNEIEAATPITPFVIDFPQMVSIDHPNAEMYFDRDVKCIKDFFEKRFHFVSDEAGPFFSDVKGKALQGSQRIDVEVEASGFSKKMAKELEKYMLEVGADMDHTEEAADCDTEVLDSDHDPSEGDNDGQLRELVA